MVTEGDEEKSSFLRGDNTFPVSGSGVLGAFSSDHGPPVRDPSPTTAPTWPQQWGASEQKRHEAGTA